MASRIHDLVRSDGLEKLRKALEEGAVLDNKDEFGVTALQHAVAQKIDDAALLLLHHGADGTLRDPQGKTALHYAVEWNRYRVAEELIKRAPSIIEIADNFGNQPLWTAAFNARGDYRFVELLLKHGADPCHVNNVGKTPQDIGTRKQDEKLLQLLKSKSPPN
jgi:ankyrin repeat protein